MTKLQHDSRTKLLDATLKVVRAKAKGSAAVAAECLDHLRLYMERIFTRTSRSQCQGKKGEIKTAPRLKRERRRMLESSI